MSYCPAQIDAIPLGIRTHRPNFNPHKDFTGCADARRRKDVCRLFRDDDRIPHSFCNGLISATTPRSFLRRNIAS